MMTCPITLEPIDEENIFYHTGTAFDVFALYTYLLTAVYLTNPVSRMPFTDGDLCALEAKIRSLCGEDAIVTTATPDDTLDVGTIMIGPGPGPPEAEAEPTHEIPEMAFELEVLPVTTEELIRLQVRLNMPDTSSSPTCYNNTPEPSEDDNDDFFEDTSFFLKDAKELPPVRLFPSIVEMSHDPERSQRLKAKVDLLQYLTYDCTDTLLQIVSLSCDSHFHQMVWEHTSSSVLSTVQQLVGNANRSVDIEVTYAECWDTYRAGLLTFLNQKYVDSVQDMRRVDPDEANTLIRNHVVDVENNVFLTEERKNMIIAFLQRNLPL